jgi:hypothetical protein
VGSLRTNLAFLRKLAVNPAAKSGDTTTDLIARHPELTAKPSAAPSLEVALALATFQLLAESEGAGASPIESTRSGSLWMQIARQEGVRR